MTVPTLVVIRGNSGSGKTTAAREVRRRYGRGCALLEQDYLRRVILREHDTSRSNPVAPTFITTTARTALDLGYHVVLEGILHTERYAAACTSSSPSTPARATSTTSTSRSRRPSGATTPEPN
jgi:predicted kinase